MLSMLCTIDNQYSLSLSNPESSQGLAYTSCLLGLVLIIRLCDLTLD